MHTLCTLAYHDELKANSIKVGLIQYYNIRDKLSTKKSNSARNLNKLKNPATPSSGGLFSLSTGTAEIFIFVVLRVQLQFFISRDVVLGRGHGNCRNASHNLEYNLSSIH